jgi:hypothetical protein
MNSVGKTKSPINDVGTRGTIRFVPTSHYSNYWLQMDHRLEIKKKTVKLLEAHVGKCFSTLGKVNVS